MEVFASQLKTLVFIDAEPFRDVLLEQLQTKALPAEMIADGLRRHWNTDHATSTVRLWQGEGHRLVGLAEAVGDRDLSLLHAAGFHGVYADASHEDFD